MQGCLVLKRIPYQRSITFNCRIFAIGKINDKYKCLKLMNPLYNSIKKKMLNFVKVDEGTLIRGTKYKIIDIYNYNPHEYIVTFDGYSQGNNILSWINLSFYKTVNNETLYYRYTTDNTMFLKYKYSTYVYKLVSSKEQIQQDMENRAVNLILQTLIPNFQQ